MTPSREANDFAHTHAPTALMGRNSYARHRADTTGNRGCHFFHFVAADRTPIARRLVAACRVQCSVAYRGRVSWGEYLRRWLSHPPKLTDHPVGQTTKWSVRSFLTLLQRFGRRTQPRISQRSLAAVFALPKDISAANENGPAMRSRPSFPKFSGVTPCGTSRSFPNGDRRPF